MAVMTIRDIDEAIATRLRARASRNGTSMEEEARDILRSVLSTEASNALGLGRSIHARFAALGGVDLPDLKRMPRGAPVTFDE